MRGFVDDTPGRNVVAPRSALSRLSALCPDDRGPRPRPIDARATGSSAVQPGAAPGPESAASSSASRNAARRASLASMSASIASKMHIRSMQWLPMRPRLHEPRAPVPGGQCAALEHGTATVGRSNGAFGSVPNGSRPGRPSRPLGGPPRAQTRARWWVTSGVVRASDGGDEQVVRPDGRSGGFELRTDGALVLRALQRRALSHVPDASRGHCRGWGVDRSIRLAHPRPRCGA